jgi:hypothetical protein
MASNQQPTAEEISKAYRQARLRYLGITLNTALTNPLIYKSLSLQVMAMRKSAALTQSQPYMEIA